uniref:Uncharacterized protein n=1 Tax=Zea mays TaxID=4577 RepID=A0A804N0U6_MAIZE
MTTKRCSCPRFMYVITMLLAVIVSCYIIVDCSAEVQEAQPDGGHEGWAPPPPRGGTVQHMCPDPEPECRHPGAPPPPPPTPHRRKIARPELAG